MRLSNVLDVSLDGDRLRWEGASARSVAALIGGRKYGGGYTLPACYEALWMLKRAPGRVRFDDAADALLNSERRLVHHFTHAEDDDSPVNCDAWARAQLEPWQRLSIRFLMSRPDGGLLQLDPGLGKTAVALLAANELSLPRILIATQVSLIPWWRDSIAVWTPRYRAESCVQGRPELTGELFQATITSISTLAKHPMLYRQPPDARRWSAFILDESIAIQHRKTQRFKALKSIRPLLGRVWHLSGFPLTGFCDDYWSQFHLVLPRVFASYWRWVSHWCHTVNRPWATEIVGNRDPEELQDFLSRIRLVRSQEQVADIPDFDYNIVSVELRGEQAKAYRSMEDEWIAGLPPNFVTADLSLTQQLRLQQIASSLATISESHRGQTNNAKLVWMLRNWKRFQLPVVIWSQWTPTIRQVQECLNGQGICCATLEGATPQEERQRLVDALNAKHLDALICQVRAGKYGLNMPGAMTAIYLDRGFSPDDWTQSLRRLLRLGRRTKPTCYILLATHTLDALIHARLAGKIQSLDELTPADLLIYIPSLAEKLARN